jgi:GxxExxY protein
MTVDKKYLHSDISDSVLKAFYVVRDSLPFELSLDIYKRALDLEMKDRGLVVDADKEFKLKYKDKIIGSFFTDFIVNDAVIIIVIKNDMSCDPFVTDAKNRLRLTNYEVAMILNFASDANSYHKRVVLTNDFKKVK